MNKKDREDKIGRTCVCYVRRMNGDKQGPYTGTIKGLSDDEVHFLVDIPEMGSHRTYGEWFVRIKDCELFSSGKI